MGIFFYADAASVAFLDNTEQKILLVGGDLGYGNFGDILQLRNSVELARLAGRFGVVVVLGAAAIFDDGYPEWARKNYAADAILFVSDHPLQFGDRPALQPVQIIRNIACVHLYGGGYLNEFWGRSQLDIVEALRRSAPRSAYVMSGQQVTPPFHSTVAEHIAVFRPILVGLRDELSVSVLREQGVDVAFSFDDATEALQRLTDCLPLRRGPGLLLHLNSSDYTGLSSQLNVLEADLTMLAADSRSSAGICLLQPFRDARHEVVDTRETIKSLDMHFPFTDARLLELAGLALSPRQLSAPVTGEIGYSCSYHVALWLQLSGIPCFLHGANVFYNQKSQALQIRQDLGAFLKDPVLADHRINLERRAAWLERFRNLLTNIPDVDDVARFEAPPDIAATVPLMFKGMPSLHQRLRMMEEELVAQRERSEHMAALRDEAERERAALQERFESERVAQRQRFEHMVALKEGAERKLASVEELLESERRLKDDLHGRVVALSVCVTELGSAIRAAEHRRADFIALSEQISRLTDSEERGRLALADAEERLRVMQMQVAHLEQLLAAVYTSTSWKMTRVPRALIRYFRLGHFDQNGQVGLFALAQRIGRSLPISTSMRRRIGVWLARYRRRGL